MLYEDRKERVLTSEVSSPVRTLIDKGYVNRPEYYTTHLNATQPHKAMRAHFSQGDERETLTTVKTAKGGIQNHNQLPMITTFTDLMKKQYSFALRSN